MENENGNISKSTRNQETSSEKGSSQETGSEKGCSQETGSEKSGWQRYSGRVILPRKGRSVSPPFFFRLSPQPALQRWMCSLLLKQGRSSPIGKKKKIRRCR